jgi:hypothetical protein
MKMLLKKKGQSTAEYAIVIGLVIAVAAGILQVTLKHGIAQKNKQGVDWMLKAGDTELGTTGADTSMSLYTQDLRKTTVDAADYEDTSVMKRGGSEEKKQVQTTETTAASIETIDAGNE